MRLRTAGYAAAPVAAAVCAMGLAPGRCAASHLRRHARQPSHAAEPAIAVDRLVKVYKAVTAVDGISFALAAGLRARRCSAATAPARPPPSPPSWGWSTPTSGRVTVLGAEMPRQRHRVLHRMNFESPYVEHADAAHGAAEPDRVRHALRRATTSPGASRALADELDLDEFLDRPTGKLSSGQKTRVSLAKSLINQPEILLLDEPTASLDPDTADWVRGRLERYRRERRRHRAARLAQHGARSSGCASASS